MEKQKPKKYEDRLMNALAFDETDLEANQMGHFSPEQTRRLKSARNSAVLAFALMWLMCSILAVVVVGLGLKATDALPFVVAGMAAAGFFFFSGSEVRQLLHDLRENQPHAAEGRIDLSLKSQQYSAEYFARVNGVQFRVQKDAFLALKNGDPYRIYYTPRSKRILSAEWLRDSDDPFIEDTQEQDEAQEDESMPAQRRLSHP